VGRSVGGDVFAHVAQHARRTVNPPDDTWVAFGPDARGYKKHSHFKIAVSRSAVRFLFEIGPEHADKPRWATAWKKNAPKVGPVLRRVKQLAWFKNEHDEEPAAPLADFTHEKLGEHADDLSRMRYGHFVVGRRASRSTIAGSPAKAPRWFTALRNSSPAWPVKGCPGPSPRRHRATTSRCS